MGNKIDKWRKRICEVFDFSHDIMGAGTIQLIEDEKMIILGCCVIDKYSECSVLLTMKKRQILVLGEHLSAKVFVNRKLEIDGIIHSVHLNSLGKEL